MSNDGVMGCLFRWANQHVGHMMAPETHVLPADGAADGGVSEECWGYGASLLSECKCIFDGFHQGRENAVVFVCIFSSEPHGDVIPATGWCSGSSRGTVRAAAGKLFLQLLPAVVLPVLLQQPVQLPAVPGEQRRQRSTPPSSQINRNCLTVHNSRFLNGRSMAAWNMCCNDWCWSLWYHKSPLRPLL